MTTEVAILVMVLRNVVKGVHRELTFRDHNLAPFEIRRDAKGTASTPLAVCAVANTVDRWCSEDRNSCATARAFGCSLHEVGPEGRSVRPNVGVKRETPVWRLARVLHDEPLRLAGQVPRRWLSA